MRLRQNLLFPATGVGSGGVPSKSGSTGLPVDAELSRQDSDLEGGVGAERTNKKRSSREDLYLLIFDVCFNAALRMTSTSCGSFK